MSIQNIKIPFDGLGNLIWRFTSYNNVETDILKDNYIFEARLKFVRYKYINSGLGFIFADEEGHTYYMNEIPFKRVLELTGLHRGETELLRWTFKKTGAITTIMMYEESDI